jgi:hypothetical protein
VLTGVIDLIIRFTFPKAPPWIGMALSTVIPAVIDLVEAAGETEKTGGEKFAFVASEVEELLAESMAHVPAWHEWNPQGRQRITEGLTELAVFIHALGANEQRAARRQVRRALRKLR